VRIVGCRSIRFSTLLKPRRNRSFSARVVETLSWAAAARAQLELSHRPDELHRVPTEDGASIALSRYYPRQRRRFAEPVILCHGLGANRFNLDFDERYSVARFLAARGFETWVMELRGRGLAGPPVDATFDDQAQHDAGAALRTVLATGAKQVTWVGHSKGGMIAFAHLARNPSAPIRAIVGLGSPGTFGVQHGLRHFIRSIHPFLKLHVVPTGKLTALARLGAPPGPITRYMLNLDNMEEDVVRRSLANVPADVPGGVARQFARWIATGNFDSADGSFDYRRQMADIRTPVLFLAGAKDLLAPPAAIRVAQLALGGPTELVLASRAHGFCADYGHADLVLGRRAPEEVFPHLAGFLAAHSTPVA
jgi:predicted alpha/beta hydrolase